MPVNQISQQLNSVIMALAGAQRIFVLMDEQPEDEGGGVTLVNVHEEDGALAECGEKTGHWAWKEPETGRLVPLRPDWEAVKVGIMEEIVRAKFIQHPELAARLLATGDKVLVEGNHWGDTFWGVDTRTGQGHNHLGRILMKVREELHLQRERDSL